MPAGIGGAGLGGSDGGSSEGPLFAAMAPAKLHQQTPLEGLLCVSSTPPPPTPSRHPCPVPEAPSFCEPDFSCLCSGPEVAWGQTGGQKPLGPGEQGQHLCYGGGEVQTEVPLMGK